MSLGPFSMHPHVITPRNLMQKLAFYLPLINPAQGEVNSKVVLVLKHHGIKTDGRLEVWVHDLNIN